MVFIVPSAENIFRAQPCNLVFPSRQMDVLGATCTWKAFELELKLCRSISGSHTQEHTAMGKNWVLMEESICVGQAMFMEMKVTLRIDARNEASVRGQSSALYTVSTEFRSRRTVPSGLLGGFYPPED